MKSYQPPARVDDAGNCTECGEHVTNFGTIGWICSGHCPWYLEADRLETEAIRQAEEAKRPDLSTLLGQLQAAELASRVFVAGDGYNSIAVRTNEEAAKLAHQVVVEWYHGPLKKGVSSAGDGPTA